jgi:hypothetical protein
MRSFLANQNLFAVSAGLKETALNTAQTLDTSMLIATANMIGIEPRTEDNSNEANGKEEPDVIYNLGNLSSGPLDFERAQAQHFAFLYAFGLGVDVPSAWGTGYQHLITPIADNFNHPSFTGAQRIGSTVFKKRFASLFVDGIKATFAKDSWAKVNATIKGTGQSDKSITSELITAAFSAASLTLAASPVQGALPADRLNSIHQVRVKVPATGEWQDVAVTAVSGATPAVLTVVAAGIAATSTTFEVLYSPTEAAWATFPARIVETPLRVTDLVVNIGGQWNGTAILGGHAMSSEIESIEHSLTNNLKTEFRAGGSTNYANSVFREGRVQTLSLDRQARDYIMQQKLDSGEYFAVSMKATGVEFETGKNYYVWLIFPRCSLMKAPLKVNGKLLGETGDLKVLEDGTYGSIIVKVGNKVSAYAA